MLPSAFGPRATLHNFGAKFFSVDLGTSQYLHNIKLEHKPARCSQDKTTTKFINFN